ncbi:MAG TPA: AAA family ATPase [Dehalococcoidia bacterium]|nr:AAA family ATPase [Dehalococcoidia bacterium]
MRRFRAINDGRIIEFSPGLNIIKGSDNESGKSSLRMAITKALFQDTNTSREDVVGLTSWGAQEPWEIELDFENDSGAYRLVKSLKTKSSQMVDARSSRVVASNRSAIAAKMAEFTGCPSEVFFESTACIGQEELVKIVPRGISTNEQQKAAGMISQRLQASIGNAEAVDIRSILAKLLSKTTRKEAKGPYWHLQRINERADKLRSQKADLGAKVKLVMENRKKLNSVKEQLAQIETRLPPAEALLKKSKNLLETEAEVEAGKTQYDNYRRAKELRTELERMDQELKEFAPFIGAEDKRALISEVRTEGERLRIQQSHLENDLEAVSTERPVVWPVLLGTALLVAGALVGFLLKVYLVGIPAAVVGIALLAYAVDRRLAWRRRLRLAQANMLKGEVSMSKNERALQNALSQFGFQDYDEYVRQLGKCDRQIDKRNETAHKLSGITGDRGWSAFELENRDLDLHISAKQKELKELLGFKMGPLQLQELEAEVDQLRKQRAELESSRARLEGGLEATEVETERLAAVEEELNWLGQEAGFWERKKRVYDITRETLEDSYTQTVSRAASVLDRELGRYISTITDGRYSRVEINDKDLSISTYSAESGEKVSVRDLSRATQDQFYISARFARIRLVTEGKKPPLLLDDPFVNYHEKRLKRMMGLLQQLAKDNQILLFTCSDAYDAYGNVISLD